MIVAVDVCRKDFLCVLLLFTVEADSSVLSAAANEDENVIADASSLPPAGYARLLLRQLRRCR